MICRHILEVQGGQNYRNMMEKDIRKLKKSLKFKTSSITKTGPKPSENHKNESFKIKFSQLTLQSLEGASGGSNKFI